MVWHVLVIDNDNIHYINSYAAKAAILMVLGSDKSNNLNDK